MQRVARKIFIFHQPVNRIHQRHVRSGDCRGARAAIGLQHIAVDRDRPFADCPQVHDRAQRSPDQPLNFQCPATLFPADGFSAITGMGCPGQQTIFSGQPTLTRSTQPWRNPVIDADRAKNSGSAAFSQHRTFRVTAIATGKPELTHFIVGSSTRSHRLPPGSYFESASGPTRRTATVVLSLHGEHASIAA